MKNKLNELKIGSKFDPFIIAELSANHNGSLKKFLKMITIAKKIGVSAVKIQTYTAEDMTVNSNRGSFFISEKNNLWKGQKLYDLYKKGTTPLEWHSKLFKHAKKEKILLFSTPFSVRAVNFLEKFKPKLYKISSFENNDFELLERVAATKKPIIISSGISNLKKFSESINFLKKKGAKNIIILKCTSSYPAKLNELNIRSIPFLKKKFKTEVGFSDHSIGNLAALTSISLGSTVIEKHFNIDKTGLDAKFSSTLDDMKSLVTDSKKIKKILGEKKVEITPSEKPSIKYKRSLILVKDIKKNEKFTRDHIKSLRGAYGVEPKFLKKLIGKTSRKNYISPKSIKIDMFKK